MELADVPLLHGLGPATEREVAALMQRRRIEESEILFEQGDVGHSLFLIERGLAEVRVATGGETTVVGLLRRGDVVGEMSLLTGEPRSASVRAIVACDVLELDRESFAALLARYPALVANLTRILSQRLAHANVGSYQRSSRGEAVALVADRNQEALVEEIVRAAQGASPRPVTTLPAPAHDDDAAVARTLEELEDLLPHHGTVIVEVTGDDASWILRHCDRVVMLTGGPGAGQGAGSLPTASPVEVVVVGAAHANEPSVTAPGETVGGVGRRLTRTRLGLALGAGGAKGYAHVGALQILEREGYSVDAVSGSSIGAIVGACIAMGMSGWQIESRLRQLFTPDTVRQLLTLSFVGVSAGVETMERVCREIADGRTFADLQIPLVVMCADLNSRLPATITDGPLDEALIAATALAGLFPPRIRAEQRLVDGLALVPVPVDAVREGGADVTVAVNLMSRDTLPAWPGEPPPDPQERKGNRMLETLLEVTDLAQLDASVQHATRADVVVTPRFGPCTWKDFHLADQFLAAGRRAAEERLSSLRTLATTRSRTTDEEGANDAPTVHAR